MAKIIVLRVPFWNITYLKCHALAQLLMASSNLWSFFIQLLKVLDKVQFAVKEYSRNQWQHPENSKTYLIPVKPEVAESTYLIIDT